MKALANLCPFLEVADPAQTALLKGLDIYCEHQSQGVPETDLKDLKDRSL